MAAEEEADVQGAKLAPVVSNNATASLPSPQESALQEIWLQVFDMATEAPQAPKSPTAVDPSALPNRPLSPHPHRQPRSYTRPANAPPTPGPSRTRRKRVGKNEHWNLYPAELHDGMYEAMRSNSPDWWITHYLRANNFNVDDALDDLLRHVHWRRRILHVDSDILRQGEAGASRAIQDPRTDAKERRILEGYLSVLQQDVVKILRGRDHNGRIMGLINVRKHRQGHESTISSTMI